MGVLTSPHHGCILGGSSRRPPMKSILASGLIASTMLLGACGSEGDPMEDPPAAAVGGQPDAAGVAYSYPSGPYGEGVGDTIKDMTFVGFVDTAADADDDPFNEPARLWSLHELYRGNDPEAKVIMMNAAAGWCGPCMQEASA